MRMKEGKMHYWKIHLPCNDVYWSSTIDFNLKSVPREAVLDGHLIDVFLPSVVNVEKISKEQYNEVMWD